MYKIVCGETGFDVTNEKLRTLKEVQQELNDIKKLITNDPNATFYNSKKHFMDSEVIAYNNKISNTFIVNKRY